MIEVSSIGKAFLGWVHCYAVLDLCMELSHPLVDVMTGIEGQYEVCGEYTELFMVSSCFEEMRLTTGCGEGSNIRSDQVACPCSSMKIFRKSTPAPPPLFFGEADYPLPSRMIQ